VSWSSSRKLDFQRFEVKGVSSQAGKCGFLRQISVALNFAILPQAAEERQEMKALKSVLRTTATFSKA
jgi:hypothetical protein